MGELRSKDFDEFDEESLQSVDSLLNRLRKEGVGEVEAGEDRAFEAIAEPVDPVPVKSLDMVRYDAVAVPWLSRGHASDSGRASVS